MSEETQDTGEMQGTIAPRTANLPEISQRFAVYLRERAELEAPIVAEELGNAQMAAILGAENEEELFTAMQMAGLTGLKDMEDGEELQINSWHVAPGSRTEFANRFNVFAVINAQYLSNGNEIAIDTGVERVIGFLRMCEQMDKFPVHVRVSKVGTGKGEMITLLPLRGRALVGEKSPF